jgi:hypothetical protein
VLGTYGFAQTVRQTDPRGCGRSCRQAGRALAAGRLPAYQIPGDQLACPLLADSVLAAPALFPPETAFRLVFVLADALAVPVSAVWPRPAEEISFHPAWIRVWLPDSALLAAWVLPVGVYFPVVFRPVRKGLQNSRSNRENSKIHKSECSHHILLSGADGLRAGELPSISSSQNCYCQMPGSLPLGFRYFL